ncbi:sperm head and tail associated protein-like, partial [Molossus nigricans]
IEFPAQSPSPLEKGHSDFPILPGSPPSSGKGLNLFLTFELPLAPRKGYSDHPNHTSGPPPNPGKRCTDSPHTLGSPRFSRDPFSGLTCSSGISSKASKPGSLPEPAPSLSPSPQTSLCLAGCSFEPCSPPLGGQYCHQPIHLGSPHLSPCFDRFRLKGSPCLHPQSLDYSLMSPQRTLGPGPQSPYIDQNTHLCQSVQYPSALVTSPVTSLPLTHVPLESGPTFSPPLAHRPTEKRPVISPPISQRGLEISQNSPLYPSWSLGRSYNDPLSSASSPPTGQFYQGYLKPPDSCEPKPQLDSSPGKNYCSSPPSSQANVPGCASSPQEGSHNYPHLPPEAHISTSGSPYGVIYLPPGIIGSSCSPQSQAPRKPCFESISSQETAGNSYLFSGTTISGPPCSQEPPLPLSSHCPNSGFSFPSPLSNQFISPPQSLRHRSCNESPLLIPVCPQVKSPKYLELKQPHTPHKHSSLVNPAQDTPSDQPKPPKVNAFPPPPTKSSGLTGPSCMVTSITTCSNSCPKKLPQGTVLPTLVPRTLKTVIPTSLPLRPPCNPILPNIYTQSHPHGPFLGAPCNTHIYSVVPPTPDPCPLSSSTGPPQCHNQPMVPRCSTYGTPRDPSQPPRQPIGPPCSTHIYSFIPLRMPFDPQSFPIARRQWGHPDTMPCGLHIYSVASQGSPKEPPQIPYSSPLPSSKNSSCSTNPSCSSTVNISECQSSNRQNKNTHQSRSQSQCESPHHPSRSQSKSKSLHFSGSPNPSWSPHQNKNQSQKNSPEQCINEDQSESLQLGIFQGRSESSQYRKSQGPRKSALHSKSWSRNKSPILAKGRARAKAPVTTGAEATVFTIMRNESQSKSSDQTRNPGQSKIHGPEQDCQP